MNTRQLSYRALLALMIGLFAAFPSFAEDPADKPVVMVRTFDVHADAAGFLAMMDKALKEARKLNPDNPAKVRVLAGNLKGEYAHLVTVATTYPTLDDFAKAQERVQNSPLRAETNKKMAEKGYKLIHTSYNTLIAEY